jgi:hypothetical protein
MAAANVAEFNLRSKVNRDLSYVVIIQNAARHRVSRLQLTRQLNQNILPF